MPPYGIIAALLQRAGNALSSRTFAKENPEMNLLQTGTTWLAGWSRMGIVLGALALAGCASVQHPPAPAQSGVENYSYLIGPGDSLNIVVWRNPELSMTTPVRPDGKISAPLVDELYVQGKNSIEVARDVEKVLGKYVRDPVVTVMVTNFVGPFSEQIRVVGEAARPQFLPFRAKMSLLDVMIAVGGLTDFADGNGATILRTAEGNKQYSVRLKDLIRRGDVTANVEMRPGDILIIPQSLF
jgi:polysaccharide biosynthesis/export protein